VTTYKKKRHKIIKEEPVKRLSLCLTECAMPALPAYFLKEQDEMLKNKSRVISRDIENISYLCVSKREQKIHHEDGI
jgi:hypothetical protein